MKEVKEVVDTVSVALANGQPEEAGNVVMQEVNHALLSMGVDEAMADKIDNFIEIIDDALEYVRSASFSMKSVLNGVKEYISGE